MGADCNLAGGGQFQIMCDFPDQVIPAGKPLWLTVTFGAPVQIERLSVSPMSDARAGDARGAGVPEATHARAVLPAFRGAAVGQHPQEHRCGEFYGENRWGPAIRELHQAIATCKDLAPQDDLVRVYDEWVWRTARDLPLWDLKLDKVPGAPEWAVLLRQTWLATARGASGGWTNRLVPTGEFGGLVGDDSDMYQNYADLPMSETTVARGAGTAAARNLAELAERENLEDGLNRHTMDPLHAYEEGMNHEALMLWWNYGDPVYFERCLEAAKSLPAATVVTPPGHRHFKSQLCGAEDLRIEPPGRPGRRCPPADVASRARGRLVQPQPAGDEVPDRVGRRLARPQEAGQVCHHGGCGNRAGGGHPGEPAALRRLWRPGVRLHVPVPPHRGRQSICAPSWTSWRGARSSCP